MDSGHPENLKRVSVRLGPSVLDFCERIYDTALKRFHAEELHQSVLHATGRQAPASADRILRDLRLRGLINYRVISRRESLYEMLWIRNSKSDGDKSNGNKSNPGSNGGWRVSRS
jgi:hypothetical protein